MQSNQVQRMSHALKALSDSNRIRILEILVTGEYCVSDLVERLQIDQPKVSHHLAILRSAGVITSRRDGRHIIYSVLPAVHRVSDAPAGTEHGFDLTVLQVTFRFPPPASAGACPQARPGSAAAASSGTAARETRKAAPPREATGEG